MNSKYYIAATVVFFASIYTLRPAPQAPKLVEIPKTETRIVRVPNAVTKTEAATTAAPPQTTKLATPQKATTPLKNQVEDFLQSSSLKQMLKNDLRALVQQATSIEVPEGSIVREEKSHDESGLYYKEMSAGHAQIKKIIAEGKIHSESYYNTDNSSSFHRQYDKSGNLRSLAIRMNEKEAVALDFYKDGQLSSVTESVDGSVTEQKWDSQNTLIRHTTSAMVNGKHTTVDHMANNAVNHHEDVFEDEDAMVIEEL